MKYLITSLLTLIVSALSAQVAGTIEYKVITKFEMEIESPAGIDLAGMLPESNTEYKALHFNQSESVYVSSDKTEDEETVLESDDGSFKMEIQMTSDKSVLHTDLKTKKTSEQKDFMGKTFLIIDNQEKINWKLTNEKIKYLGYECQKAIAQGEENKKGEPKEITAWFTTEIPVSVGPSSFKGLPGAILMLSIDGEKTQMLATTINLTPPDSGLLTAPTKGKNVTKDEYIELVEERTKEMMENSGRGTFIIRG